MSTKGGSCLNAQPADAIAQPADAVAQPADAVAQPADAIAQPGDAIAQPADVIARAADAIARADALLVTAGAGMGVDSGLPDFRGDTGFWKAYSAYAQLGLSFVDLANPLWFEDDPNLAWGFYGHRLNLYRATRPHDGFDVLRAWGETKPQGSFVFTSNVDGHFQRAGFDPERIVECHGSIEIWQCTRRCGADFIEAPPVEIAVDPVTFRALGPLPRCAGCGALARPNVLMFADGAWDATRTTAARLRFERWLHALTTRGAHLVIVECGAGTAVPTVRRMGEGLARRTRTTLIRINLREPTGADVAISIAAGARTSLARIDAALRPRRSSAF